MKRTIFISLVALGLALPGIVAADSVSGRLPVGYRTWEIKTGGAEQTVSQTYLRGVATVRLNPETNLVLSTVGASADLDLVGGATQSLGGPSDIKAQLFHEVVPDRLMLQGGLNVPSGKTELTREELDVARYLGHPLLGFNVKHFGRGLDLNGGAALSVPVSADARIGLGAGFIYHGAYTLEEGGGDFKPTPEVSLSAGIEFGGRNASGDAGRELKLLSTLRFYGEDKVDSETVFEEGTQAELLLRGRAWGGALSAFGSVQLFVKDDNTALNTIGGSIESLKQAAGTGVFSRAGYAIALSSHVRTGVEFEWNRFRGSDVVDYNGDAWGAGFTLGLSLGRGVSLNLKGMGLAGSADRGGTAADTDLSGHAVSVVLVRSGGG